MSLITGPWLEKLARVEPPRHVNHCIYHWYKDRGLIRAKAEDSGDEIDWECGSQCSRKSDNKFYSF